MKLTSLEGRLAALSGLAMALTAAVTAGLGAWTGRWDIAVWAGIVVGLVLALTVSRAWTGPIRARLRGLATAVDGLADGDFAISVKKGGADEIDELISAYNEVGEVLRRERQDLHQRELLLDTVIQATPVAMVLIDPRDRVIYSNAAARRILAQGRKLEGLAWDELVAGQPEEAAAALEAAQDGLFGVEDSEAGERQTYLLTHKDFRLNARVHRLFLIQRLTRELNRQEVATWKKVIRVISHELNNSVAPITSLAHSSRTLAQRGDVQRLDKALASVADRARHLAGFIDRYAEFARLPEPQLEEIDWADFFAGLGDTHAFELIRPLPEQPGRLDRTQFEQVLINLLKNAVEAGSDPDEITVSCRAVGGGFRIEVADRGQGMNPHTLGQALVPFYSTKREGSGIGLSLCREIVEAHNGTLGIRNRAQGGVAVSITVPA